jgi:Transposase DDE domain
VCVGFTAKRLHDSAQGGGFAEPWVSVTKVACSEGAKDSLQAPGCRAVEVRKNDENLRSHAFPSAPSGRPALKIGYPGFRKAFTLVEPVVGIIKRVLGFEQFSLRGLQKVSLEWNLVCVAYNLKRLHKLLTHQSKAPKAPRPTLAAAIQLLSELFALYCRAWTEFLRAAER